MDGPDDEGNMFERPGKVGYFFVFITNIYHIKFMHLTFNKCFYSFLIIYHNHIQMKKLQELLMKV